MKSQNYKDFKVKTYILVKIRQFLMALLWNADDYKKVVLTKVSFFTSKVDC